MKGTLPWMSLEGSTKPDIFKKIMECKLNTPVEDLCEGIDGAAVFSQYIKYCRNLRFEEKPDYQWIKNLFRNLYAKEFGEWQKIFDWNTLHVRINL